MALASDKIIRLEIDTRIISCLIDKRGSMLLRELDYTRG